MWQHSLFEAPCHEVDIGIMDHFPATAFLEKEKEE